MVLQLGSDHRQPSKRRGAFNRQEEIAQGAEAQLGQACILLQSENLLYLLFGDGPAVIAHSEEERCMIKARRKRSGGRGLNQFGAAVVAVPDSQGENARSVGALPPEQKRQIHFMLLGAHEDVVTVSRTFQDGRQASGVAEGIWIEANFDVRSQGGLAISLAVERVADKALGGGNIAVGLDRPTANHLPAPLANSLFDFTQHLR